MDDVIDHAAPMSTSSHAGGDAPIAATFQTRFNPATLSYSYFPVKAAQLFTTVGKARRVYVLATHGVFSGDSCAQLRSAPIEKVLVTNSIPQEEHVKQCDKIKVRHKQ